MAWRLADSLEVLRAEVNDLAPNRSKASDGTLGDPAHASRPSRHNPNDDGVVCALDLTDDPLNGCDIHAIARRIARNPHPELAYIISNGEVWKRSTGGWEAYTGTSPHTHHAHFGVGVGPDSEPRPPYDSNQTWGIAQEEDDMYSDADRQAATNRHAELKAKLDKILLIISNDEDGKIARRTKETVLGIRKLLARDG